MIPNLNLIIAGVVCLIAFLVVRHILREKLKLGPPGLLAAAVAGLAFIGLTTETNGLLGAILIPYEALALAILGGLLLLAIGRLLPRRSNRARKPNPLFTRRP